VRQAHHGGDAREARHFVAAQWLVKNLVHENASSVVIKKGAEAGFQHGPDSVDRAHREQSARQNT
jgi:hypothetical protein